MRSGWKLSAIENKIGDRLGHVYVALCFHAFQVPSISSVCIVGWKDGRTQGFNGRGEVSLQIKTRHALKMVTKTSKGNASYNC